MKARAFFYFRIYLKTYSTFPIILAFFLKNWLRFLMKKFPHEKSHYEKSLYKSTIMRSTITKSPIMKNFIMRSPIMKIIGNALYNVIRSIMGRVIEARKGVYKYIQIKVSDESKNRQKILIRGFNYADYHADILDREQPGLGSLGLSAKCIGGGRIRKEGEAFLL